MPPEPIDQVAKIEAATPKPSPAIWRWRDLFLDDTGKLSGTKLWTNIGHCVLSIGFMRTVWHSPLTWDLIMGYGAIVCGNRLGMAYLSKRKDCPPGGKV